MYLALLGTKVLVTVVQLLFANPLLTWDKLNTHVELFAGDMSVTKGEWEARENSGFVPLLHAPPKRFCTNRYFFLMTSMGEFSRLL